MSGHLLAMGIAEAKSETLLAVLPVCRKCLGDFERDAALFASKGLRVVRLENFALVRQLRNNAKRRGGAHGGCVGCTIDRGGLLRMSDAEPTSVADLSLAGGEA